jgi:hypothetical protein
MKLKIFFRRPGVAPLGVSFLFLFLFACTTMAPVQEMSNARQTLRAADDAEAARYAPEILGKARDLLQAAEQQLAAGDYEQARSYALSARQEAIRARQKALSQQRD